MRWVVWLVISERGVPISPVDGTVLILSVSRSSQSVSYPQRREEMMNIRLAFWIVWFLFLLLVSFVVPFLLLGGVATLGGSFTFWILWALVAILSMFVAFSRWRDSPDDDLARD
jgi:drug/metabolite transporter (DMT)-like permease